jgi:hypothetical protein
MLLAAFILWSKKICMDDNSHPFINLSFHSHPFILWSKKICMERSLILVPVSLCSFFCCVGAPSIGRTEWASRKCPIFFYTKHAAEPYMGAIQKLNNLMRRVGHHAFINLNNSKLLNCIYFCKACIPSSNTLQDLNLNEFTINYKAITNKLAMFQIWLAHSATLTLFAPRGSHSWGYQASPG